MKQIMDKMEVIDRNSQMVVVDMRIEGTGKRSR